METKPFRPELVEIANRFATDAPVTEVRPLGEGLINDSFIAVTADPAGRKYVLQRINHKVFTDVDGLMNNIAAVTDHLRERLLADGADPSTLDDRVLRFLPCKADGRYYWYDPEADSYWRVMVFIPDTVTRQEVNPESAREAGATFGDFEARLADLDAALIETIPDFHNMELRLRQFREAVEADKAGRVAECRELIDDLMRRGEEMCAAEQLHREGRLPKRVCHCDTKVNNMLYDADGKTVRCVIDLDTVMPSYVFSDFGDFLRSGANTAAEDEKDLDKIAFDLDIFRAFTEGYLSTARGFLTPLEIEMLPYAARLFPYMQAVRFLTDYLNGDTYYKIAYPEHNLVRTLAQRRLLECAEAAEPEMRRIVEEAAQ